MESKAKRRRRSRMLVWLVGIGVVWGAPAAPALTTPTVTQISPRGEICHDFPDVLVSSPGAMAYGAWMGYDFSTDQDEIYVATLSDTAWTTGVGTGIRGDLFMPRLGDAGAGGVWIIWSQQVAGNWDLYARRLDGGNLVRLTSDPGSDMNLATASDPARGRIFVVWQGFRNGRSAIFLTAFRDGGWGSPEVVSQPQANEWCPKAAVDSFGRVWIAWDSYRNGNYDVFLRSYLPVSRTFGPEVPVTANPTYEANVSMACDSDNRVWMTWETGAANWGKDQGRLTNERRLTMTAGARFLNQRRIAVGVYDGVVRTTSVPINTVYANFNNTFDPIVAVDSHDRPWIFHARRLTFGGTETKKNWAGWYYAVTRYDDSATTWAWDAPVTVPNSLARIERKMAVARYDRDRLVALWHVDGRNKSTVVGDMRHGPPDGKRIQAALIAAPNEANADPALGNPATDPPVEPTHPNEATDLAAIRTYRATINGKTYRILRGDLHRHNDISWDGSGDSSLEDLFRYAYDVAALDFIMPSDHHGHLLANNVYPNWNFYPWRRIQKYDELHYSPGVMMSFFGYERSRSYPNGHRNVVYPTRSPRGDWIVPSQPADPLGSDQAYLWDRVKPRGGVTIPHTPGNNMGTSWEYDVDTDVETVVEIYQGCRYSYEHYVTSPSLWPNIEQRVGVTGNETIRPLGFYFSLLSQRLPNGDFRNKLGIFSSSDHGSTHLSYGCVFVEKATREEIIKAIKARHTYGAMDNIIVDVRCGDAMMGDEIVLRESPTLRIHIQAPKALNQVAVIRDNEIIYTNDPSGDPDPTRFVREVTDFTCAAGYHYYYVRARQSDGRVEADGAPNDGTLAWSSPIWVQRQAGLSGIRRLRWSRY